MYTHLTSTLANGLTVIRVPMPAVRSVTVLALANTGSRYENPEKYGIAHFFEHIVFKGTTEYPSAQILSAAIDGIGADFNAFTSKEYTGYYVKSASAKFQTSLSVVSDMMLAPLIKQEDVERERGVIIEEINMYQDTPMRNVGSLFEEMVFAGSGLSHDILGTKETVSGITSEDFRTFLKQWYGLHNLVLVVAGDASVVEPDSCLDAVTVAFSKQHESRASKHVPTAQKAQKEPQISEEKLLVSYKKTEQAHLILGWQGIERSDKRKYALSVLDTILGGTMSSRLFTEVREKRGLCYYVRSEVDHYHNTGIFGASAGVDPTRIDEALKTILGEFAALLDGSKPVTQEELGRAKDTFSGTMTLGLEDSRQVAQFFGMKQLLSQKTQSPDEVLQKIMAVTLEEVQQVAQDLVADGGVRLAVIGPYKGRQRFAKILGI